MKFLRDKPDELIFNTPRGKLDKLDTKSLKYFLCVNGPNKQRIIEPLERNGWSALPFFVIDPYNRVEFPSVNSNLIEGSAETRLLLDKISKTC